MLFMVLPGLHRLPMKTYRITESEDAALPYLLTDENGNCAALGDRISVLENIAYADGAERVEHSYDAAKAAEGGHL